MASNSFGTLEVVASASIADQGQSRLLEFGKIDLFDRKIAAGIERRLAEYPAIAIELAGGMSALQEASEGLSFIDDRFTVTSHSGPLDYVDIGPLATDDPPSSRLLVQVEHLRGDVVINLTLEDMVFRQGSTIRSSSVAASRLSGRAGITGYLRPLNFLLGVVVSAIVGATTQLPEIRAIADGIYDDERVAIVEQMTEASQSSCALTINYVADVEAMRSAISDTYNFEATDDPKERRRRICNLQVALKVVGRDAVGKIDGVLGPKTLSAWRAFRKSHDLEGAADSIDYLKLAEAFRVRLEDKLFWR